MTAVPTPRFSMGDSSVVEGLSGIVQIQFVVTLSEALGQASTVNWATEAPGTASISGSRYGSASAGVDYKSGSGTLTFAAGETQKIITIDVLGDAVVEADELFFVNLSNAVGAVIADYRGEGLIRNDDAPLIAITGGSVLEGGAGQQAALPFTVQLSAPTTETVTVAWKTGNGTALAGSDYTAASGVLTFAPGEMSKAISVAIQGDTVVEADETVTIELSAPIRASFPINYGAWPHLPYSTLTATGTILADDITPATAAVERLNLSADGAQANASVTSYAVATSGTRLALISSATNLIANDTNASADLFTRDLTTLGGFSRAVSGFENLGDGWSAYLSTGFLLSADGGRVAFQGWKASVGYDLFIKDLGTGAVQRLGIETPSNLAFTSISLSANGHKVAFVIAFSSLVAGDTTGGGRIFSSRTSTRAR